ncbi:MAG: ABC transporter substrate-binding protein [Ruegeria sp.]
MRNPLLSLALIASLWGVSASAFEIEDRQWVGPENARALTVISTTDFDILAPLMESFLRNRPGVAVDYVVASSSELMKAIADEGQTFDVALSSAMDLQTKLANDGFTRPHQSSATALIPDWGEWRNHVFAFSQEPASMVVSATALTEAEMPRTRQALITLLREQPDRFRGRIGTYDVSLSGLGYLFATQDARTSETYWRLMELMGGLDLQLYCCSGAMIEQVADGEIFVAYNVLGSYARARADLADRIVVIDPEDYTHLMMRSAILLNDAAQPELAEAFVDHLITAAWSNPPTPEYPFRHPLGAPGPSESARRPIQLGPGLLVYQDREKRKRFLGEWVSALRQE